MSPVLNRSKQLKAFRSHKLSVFKRRSVEIRQEGQAHTSLKSLHLSLFMDTIPLC